MTKISWSKVNIWYVNCARATAFIFDTRMGVLVKVSKFLRQKMSRPEGDSNPQVIFNPLRWRHNGHGGVSNHHPTIVYSTVWSDADQRKHQSSALLTFVWGIHRWPVNSPHKWPVTRKMFPFDNVITLILVIDGWGRYLLWNVPPMNVIGCYWWPRSVVVHVKGLVPSHPTLSLCRGMALLCHNELSGGAGVAVSLVGEICTNSISFIRPL